MSKKVLKERYYNVGIVESYKKVSDPESPILGTFKVDKLTVENTPSLNGRVYPTEAWTRPDAFGRGGKFIDENGKLKPSSLFGSVDHPLDDRAEFILAEGAIAWKDISRNADGSWSGEAHIMNTPNGKIVKTYLDYAKQFGGGELLGVSSRAIGESYLQESNGSQYEVIRPESFELMTFDFVYNPAFVTAQATLTESKKGKSKTLLESFKQLLEDSADTPAEEVIKKEVKEVARIMEQKEKQAKLQPTIKESIEKSLDEISLMGEEDLLALSVKLGDVLDELQTYEAETYDEEHEVTLEETIDDLTKKAEHVLELLEKLEPEAEIVEEPEVESEEAPELLDEATQTTDVWVADTIKDNKWGVFNKKTKKWELFGDETFVKAKADVLNGKLDESFIIEDTKVLEESVFKDLEPEFDHARSFYGKAYEVKRDGKHYLVSYQTKVAEIIDGKPVVYGTYSQTTLRHIKEWLKQLGFKAETKAQIMKDYGEKSVHKESVEDKISALKKEHGDLVDDEDEPKEEDFFAPKEPEVEDTDEPEVEEIDHDDLLAQIDELKEMVKELQDLLEPLVSPDLEFEFEDEPEVEEEEEPEVDEPETDEENEDDFVEGAEELGFTEEELQEMTDEDLAYLEKLLSEEL